MRKKEIRREEVGKEEERERGRQSEITLKKERVVNRRPRPTGRGKAMYFEQ